MIHDFHGKVNFFILCEMIKRFFVRKKLHIPDRKSFFSTLQMFLGFKMGITNIMFPLTGLSRQPADPDPDVAQKEVDE